MPLHSSLRLEVLEWVRVKVQSREAVLERSRAFPFPALGFTGAPWIPQSGERLPLLS